MKKYIAYKDSSIEWIGKIPEHWIQYKIKFVIAKKGYKAGPFGSSLITGDLLDFGDYKVFTPEHVAEKNILEEWYLPNERINEMNQFIVNDNDVVLPIVGTLGLAKVFNTSIDGKGIINQRLAKLTCDDKKISPQFLCLTLMGVSNYQEYFKLQSRGAILSHLNKETIVSMPIVLPSIEEQAKIINYINDRTSKIELLIEKKQQLIRLLKEEKITLVNHLVTRGLNSNVKVKESGFEFVETVPIHWEVRNFQTVAKDDKYSFTGGPFGSDLKFSDYTESGVRIIQLQNIGDGNFNDKYKIYTSIEKADELRSCNIYPNDIIIAKMADPVARACIMPNSSSRFLMASDGIRLSVNEVNYDNKFILYAINSNYFRKQAEMNSSGSTRLRIGLNQLKKLKLILPPKEEQVIISKYIENKILEIDTIILKTEKEIALMKEYKTALISEVVTGKIDVRDEVIV